MFRCPVTFSLPFQTLFPSFHVDSILIAIMVSPPIPRFSAITTFILFALLWRTSAQDIDTVFTVASGNELSSCDQYLGPLNAQFTEAMAIGTAGLAAMQTIKAKTTSRTQRRMLYAMYGLDVYDFVSGGSLEKGDASRINTIRGTTLNYFPFKQLCTECCKACSRRSRLPLVSKVSAQDFTAILPFSNGRPKLLTHRLATPRMNQSLLISRDPQALTGSMMLKLMSKMISLHKHRKVPHARATQWALKFKVKMQLHYALNSLLRTGKLAFRATRLTNQPYTLATSYTKGINQFLGLSFTN